MLTEGERDVTYTWSTDSKTIERSGAGHLNGAREKAEVRLESTQSRQYYSYDPVIVQVPIFVGLFWRRSMCR